MAGKSKSKNLKQRGLIEYCRNCKKEINVVWEATMPIKQNGHHAFKIKLVRQCCNS